MLEKALRYLVELSKPELNKIGDETYSDKELYRISHNPKARTIELCTLTSLVDYIKSGVDAMDAMIIHVKSPTKVQMYSALDHERSREYIVEVNAELPRFDFNRFVDHESFCIALQSKFVDCVDRALLLKFAGTVEAGSVAEYGDDGVTQKATVKTGIASKSDAIIPNPVALKPYRTFLEVDQPVSSFVFRMQGDRRVECALYEADGGAWRFVAMQNIKKYLEEALEPFGGFTIIC